MKKDWKSLLEEERNTPVATYVQGCRRKYDFGIYWIGRYYASNRPEIHEAICEARTFEYMLQNLPLTLDPRQAIAGGGETYMADDAPEEIKSNYWFHVGAYYGHGYRDFIAGYNHTIVFYPRLLKEGFAGTLKRIEASRKAHRNASGKTRAMVMLDAMEISVKAIMDFFRRFGESAEDKEIAERLIWLSEKPPRDFRDALQMAWLMFVILEAQQRPHNALGRIDQYLYPFYKKDIKSGKLTEEQALDLICHVWTKVEGMHETTNICIGGLTPDGKCAENELSFIMLKATELVKSPSTNLSARLSDKSTDAFILACAQVISTGIGFPAIFNDEVTVKMLERRRVPSEIARDYCMVGCVETLLAGRQQAWSDSRFDTPLSASKVFDRLETFSSYDEMYDAMMAQIDKDIAAHVDEYNKYFSSYPVDRFPDPVLSAFTEDCIARAKDINGGGAQFKRYHGVGMMGLGTLADSLAAIKKLVFEEKAVSALELRKALDDDFKGKEPLRQMLLNRAPKYGNDIAYVDDIAMKLVSEFGKMWQKYRTSDGGRFFSCMATNISNIESGNITKATPDGRHAHTRLSDAASPFYGRDMNGPTAFLKSICKPDYTDQNCTVVNMRFLPEFFGTKEGKMRFLALVREFIRSRAHELQFNVTDNALLEKALKSPEEYQNLMVRVSGFSAYFTRLPKEVQVDIMQRRAHNE
ncbi:MAG: hypothetical protein J5833_01265 [Victivallales bacterium]|nr:hypothetical protein [Victivallales bacterium]